MNKFVVSPSPHIHSGLSTAQCMYGVLIALIPAFLVSLYYFGLGALLVTVTSVLSCVIFEYLIQKYLLKGRPTIANGSAILTGVLLAFNLPSNLPLWIVVIGALFAIGIGKMAFGGLGSNIFNPALAGRIFLLISFPQQMTTWPRPANMPMGLDGETGATTLNILKYGSTDDIINIDIPNRTVNVELSDEELAQRRAELEAGDGYVAHRDRKVSQALKAYAAFARSADKGATRDPELIDRLSGLA